jgi:hypothetical protein
MRKCLAYAGHQLIHKATAHVAIQLGASHHRRHRGRDDVLLGENTLDDTGGSTDGLEEAGVSCNNKERRSLGNGGVVPDLKIELESKVSYAET